MKKLLFIITLINLLLLPNFTYATSMPGTGDYAILLGIFGLIVGAVIATIFFLAHYFIAKTRFSPKKYFKIGLIITLAIPIILILAILAI